MDLPGASLLAPPPRRHALAVSTHAVRLSSIAANLRQRAHYDEVTACTDTAAAMAELRGGHKFEVMVVDMYSLRYRAAPAFELLECAIDEMHVETYAVSEIGLRYGPIVMEDLNKIRKDIYNKASNGFKSPEAKPNGSCNSSSVMTTPTTTTLLISGRRATRRRMSRTQVSDTNSQEERDGGNVKNEQQNPAEKPKKARLVWTDELHKKFVEAHDKLLPGDAVPKKILKLMNDSTLTRENIASHLQKHRMNIDPLRRGNPKIKHQKLTPPQASLSSPNLSQQQASPTMMQPLSSSNFSETFTTQGVVYMNHNMNVQPMVKPPTNSDMQDSHPVMDMQSFKDSILFHTECVFPDVASKDMYTRDNKSKQNCTWCPDTSDISEILDKDPKPSWDVKYLFSYGY